MPMTDYFTDIKPTWCPGCGNFGIRTALAQALDELQLPQHKLLMFTDVGCSGNQSSWYKMYTFHSLHGRSLPPAVGAKIVNPELTVLAQCGDGGAYGEGTNHLIHAARKNINLTYLVHNNQLYSLTTGQATPTSEEKLKTKSTPYGVVAHPLNPLTLAIASGATFVARGFCGDIPHLKELIKAAIQHQGFAFIDILQNCITFNKINTNSWFRERVYKLENHDTSNKIEALKKSLEWDFHHDSKIALGIFYQEQRHMIGSEKDLTKENIENIDISKIIDEFI
ncbi:2-oxoacid ferredoxin oxidoreductase [Candidatus Woesearchaeota archaeon]|nr:2-oxoacid ferredoxin oxidoreductase [Candidatus Woesearchaeota archaeon]